MNNLIASNRDSSSLPPSTSRPTTSASPPPTLRPDLICELPDGELLERVHDLAARERNCTAQLVAHLAEVELRRLFLSLGCSSMFAYCTEVLHLSESAAYARIEVARAVRRLPRLLPDLADGSLSLTTIRRLAPLLTAENFDRLVRDARHRTAREVDALAARERPRPDVPPTIRRLPRRRRHVSKRVESGTLELEAPRATPEPIAPERFRVQFTAGAEMRERIQRLQNLLRHRIPDGDLATVIDTALIELLSKLERRKFGATAATRSGTPHQQRQQRQAQQEKTKDNNDATASTTTSTAESTAPSTPRRSIALALRNFVWQRDDGRCRFVSTDGRRCSATCYLEFHHVAAFARGGETTEANLELRCRAHNAHEAEIAGLGYRGP